MLEFRLGSIMEVGTGFRFLNVMTDSESYEVTIVQKFGYKVSY